MPATAEGWVLASLVPWFPILKVLAVQQMGESKLSSWEEHRLAERNMVELMVVQSPLAHQNLPSIHPNFSAGQAAMQAPALALGQ